jgi:hypothetical protein
MALMVGLLLINLASSVLERDLDKMENGGVCKFSSQFVKTNHSMNPGSNVGVWWIKRLLGEG